MFGSSSCHRYHVSFCLRCRLFLTLCEIIKRQVEGKHSPSGVQVMGAVLTLAELFEDFVTGSHLADVPVDCNGATAMELGLDTKRCTSEVCLEGDDRCKQAREVHCLLVYMCTCMYIYVSHTHMPTCTHSTVLFNIVRHVL